MHETTSSSKPGLRAYIHADANASVGFGHMMRITVLADELRRRGVEVLYLIRDGEAARTFLEERNYKYHLLPGESSLTGLLDVADTEGIASLLDPAVINLCIDDHPGSHTEYLAALKSTFDFIMTMTVEGLNERYYPCDIVMNQNYKASPETIRAPDKAVKLTGVDYVLLRDSFTDKEPPQRDTLAVNDVYINFGGGDMYNQSCRLARIITSHPEELESITFTIVVGPAYQFLAELEELAGASANIHVIQNPANLEEIMGQADVAVTASGSTCWELAYLGVPALLLIIADNQERLAKQLDADGYYTLLGWYSEVSDEQIFDGLRGLIENYPTMRGTIDRLQSLVDGKGKQRVVDAIFQLVDAHDKK